MEKAAEPDLKADKDHLMIISPDEGAMQRAVYFSNVLGVDTVSYTHLALHHSFQIPVHGTPWTYTVLFFPDTLYNPHAGQIPVHQEHMPDL